jgi:hypothetical protein
MRFGQVALGLFYLGKQWVALVDRQWSLRVAFARNWQQKRDQIQDSTIRNKLIFPCAKRLTYFWYRSKYSHRNCRLHMCSMFHCHHCCCCTCRMNLVTIVDPFVVVLQKTSKLSTQHSIHLIKDLDTGNMTIAGGDTDHELLGSFAWLWGCLVTAFRMTVCYPHRGVSEFPLFCVLCWYITNIHSKVEVIQHTYITIKNTMSWYQRKQPSYVIPHCGRD